MQLRELEKLSEQYPQLRDLFVRYENFLIEVSAKPDIPDIYPVTIAKHLSTTEARATALLGLLADAGLLTPRYLVQCPAGFFIQEYADIKDIPREIDCPEHNTSHDIDTCQINLVFRFTEQFKEKYSALAAAYLG